MVYEEDVPGGTIRYRGLFDWGGLYYSIADWFKRYNFYLHEETYKHKVPSPRGAEQELNWYGDIEMNEFIKFRIKVDFHIWDMTELEVVKNGKKKLLTNARIEIKLSGKITWDWQGRFEKNKFTRALQGLWVRHIFRREVSSLWGDMLFYRMWNLHAHIKKYLDMQAQYHAYAGYLGEER